ncbi:MAG TPA: dTDP-4-dehydrorhamnose reductase [Candidatus Nitrosotenuis sp.]|nr:dTDP-4-dehydrorhamnose reductase [Candidatus Nitrosotenuis sp.]
MKILLLGDGGQLASELEKTLADEILAPVSHTQLDIRDRAAVEALAAQVRPDCIINTAAYHRVDDCEEHVEEAFAVNVSGVANVARAAARHGALLVQFSTNYVFDGGKSSPYTEDDVPQPLSVYGTSRLAGEWVARHFAPRVLLVRTCGLYGAAGRRAKSGVGNFVENMLRLAAEGKPIRVVNDQRCTPTSARELAQRLAPMLRAGVCGLFHLTNEGECSWYEFAQEIFRVCGLTPDLRPVSSAEFAARARRPAYSVLENRALRAAGFERFRPWQVALAEYLRDRV